MNKRLAGVVAAVLMVPAVAAIAASLRDRILLDVAQSFARTGSLVSEVTLIVAKADESGLPKVIRPVVSSALKTSAERIEKAAPKAASASHMLNAYTKSVREEGFDEAKHGTSWSSAVGELRASADEVDKNVRTVTGGKVLGTLFKGAAKHLAAPSAGEAVGKLEGAGPPQQEAELAAVDRVASEMQGLQKQVGLLASALFDKWAQLSKSEGPAK